MGKYEPSILGHQVNRRGHPLEAVQPASQTMEGTEAGGRCPRPHCGGLMVARATVTVDGTCEELVCASCARSRLVRVVEPYRPMVLAPDGSLESRVEVEPDAALDSDRMWDSEHPLDLPESLTSSLGLHDAPLPGEPPA